MVEVDENGVVVTREGESNTFTGVLNSFRQKLVLIVEMRHGSRRGV